MKNECCHQHPENGDLALQTEAQRAETDLRAVNAKLLSALEPFEHYPCQGVDCTTYPAGLCPGCHARAAIEEARKC